MATELNQLILDVTDIDRSLGFYVGMLHLELCNTTVVDGHALAVLRAGGTKLLLVQQPLEYFEALSARTNGVVLNFEVHDLSGVVRRCGMEGTPVLRGIERSSTGEASMLVADPDGYALLLSGKAELVH